MNTFYRRLPLTGMQNARDLGGYPTPEGGVTRFGVFFRSEVPECLTADDLVWLRGRGLVMNIDLRGEAEAKQIPDALRAEPGIEYLLLPAFEKLEAEEVPSVSGPGAFWGARYSRMADRFQDWTKNVMEACARATGAVLFHCTTGKDRTGIVTAMLLGLCGVSDEDIAADYSLSQIYLQRMYGDLKHYYSDAPIYDPKDPFFGTQAENMFVFLDHIRSRYGSMCGYLTACGVPDDTLACIREKLILETPAALVYNAIS